MELVTLLIATTCSFLIFLRKPADALIIYILALAWYPSYVTLKLGTVDFPVSRILIIAIFFKICLSASLSFKFKISRLDKLMLVYFMAQIVSGLFTEPMKDLLINRSGACLDTICPYFAVRILLKSKKDYIYLLKGIIFLSVPLGFIGMYQSLTGKNLFGFYRQYHAWGKTASLDYLLRGNFYRAEVTFSMSIMYGLYYSILTPTCCAVVLCVKGHKKTIYTLLLIAMVFSGLACMSSGPMLAMAVSALVLCCYRFRGHWRPVVYFFLAFCIIAEIVSNRHFYDILGSLTLNPETAWHRSKLINIAFFEGGMRGHWLMGFGFKDPGWGPRLGAYVTDITNHFILILCRFGLLGLIPFILIIIESIRQLLSALTISSNVKDKKIIWCLLSTMGGSLVAMMTVSMVGQPVTCFYIFLGFCVVLNNINYNTEMKRLKQSRRRFKRKIVLQK